MYTCPRPVAHDREDIMQKLLLSRHIFNHNDINWNICQKYILVMHCIHIMEITSATMSLIANHVVIFTITQEQSKIFKEPLLKVLGRHESNCPLFSELRIYTVMNIKIDVICCTCMQPDIIDYYSKHRLVASYKSVFELLFRVYDANIETELIIEGPLFFVHSGGG